MTTHDAIKADTGKPDLTILPSRALEEVAKVFEAGAKKYSRSNYQNGNGLAWLRIAASLLRHTFAWLRREDNDPETGLSHMAHAACCTLMLLHYITDKERYGSSDNRDGDQV